MYIEKHYRKHYTSLVKRAARPLGDVHYAEDCVQETYERAIKYFGSFQGDEKDFEAWVYTIFVNCVRKYIKYIRAQGVTDEIKIADHPTFPVEICDKWAGLIQKEIDVVSLPEKTKNMLSLYYVLGYRSKEVEFMSGMSQMAILKASNRFKNYLLEKYNLK